MTEMAEYTRDNPPTIIQKKPLDVMITTDAIWCCVDGDKPFCNTICHVKESDDGTGYWFGLDSHNFAFCRHGDTIGVVEVETSAPDKYIMSALDFLAGSSEWWL